MALIWAILIVFGVTAIMVAAMLLVRRGAPDGSRFKDGDRASGVFGVLSTGFALLLGFVVFLAFTKYDDSRSGAEAEALVTLQLFETAQLMPAEARPDLSGELVCYGRSVIDAGMAGHGIGFGAADDQPVGPRPVPDVAVDRASDVQRAERVRRMAVPNPVRARKRDGIVCTRRKGSCRSRCGSCCSSPPR